MTYPARCGSGQLKNPAHANDQFHQRTDERPTKVGEEPRGCADLRVELEVGSVDAGVFCTKVKLDVWQRLRRSGDLRQGSGFSTSGKERGSDVQLRKAIPEALVLASGTLA